MCDMTHLDTPTITRLTGVTRWVVSHIWMSRIWMSHVARMKKWATQLDLELLLVDCQTWLIHMCDMTHLDTPTISQIRPLLARYAPWLIHMCDMTHLETPTISRLPPTPIIPHGSCMCVYVCVCVCVWVCQWVRKRERERKSEITHSYVWYDSFIPVTWLVHVCDRWPPPLPVARVCACVRETGNKKGHDSFIGVTWFIHVWDYWSPHYP